MTLAEIPYPRIDPVIVKVTDSFGIRWYGVAYIVAFALAWLVMRNLARRGRFPVPPDRVGDFLFWGILGVFLGGRAGYVIFYADPQNQTPAHWLKTWEGGMAFHGGLAGVIVAYFVYAWRKKIPFRWFADGLALATPLGILAVRIANFVNAELWGRPWDGPWAMRFPKYQPGALDWDGHMDTVLRHPSQIYQGLAEGLLLYVVLRRLMLSKRWGGGTVGCAFMVLYGAFRFATEFFREPDGQIGLQWFGLTRGQDFCIAMVVLGIGFFAWMRRGGAPMPAVEGVPAAEGPPLFPSR